MLRNASRRAGVRFRSHACIAALAAAAFLLAGSQALAGEQSWLDKVKSGTIWDDLMPAGPPTFRVEVPRILLPGYPESPCERAVVERQKYVFRTKTFAFEKGGSRSTTVKRYSGCDPIAHGVAALESRYEIAWTNARKNLGEKKRISIDIEPSRNMRDPYYVLRWEDREDNVVFQAWRLRCVKGKVYIGGFDLVTPSQGSPLGDSDSAHMLNTFLQGDSCAGVNLN